jgi:hypothetical protein
MERSAYYSEELKSWVRLERQADGEYCHTSGFGSRDAALEFNMDRFKDRSGKKKPLFGASGIPSFLEEFPEKSNPSAVISGRRKK